MRKANGIEKDRVPIWQVYCNLCGRHIGDRRYGRSSFDKGWEECDICGSSDVVQSYTEIDRGVVVTWGDERI